MSGFSAFSSARSCHLPGAHHDLRARRPARRAALRVRRGRMDDDQLRRRADAGRRRVSLSRRHFQRQAHPVVRNGAPVHRRPARAVVAEPHRLPHRAIPRRRRNRDLHSAHHRLHRPQSAAAPRRLRSRRLRDELGTVAERLRFARGLYRKTSPGAGSNGNFASRCRSCSHASGTERRARRST